MSWREIARFATYPATSLTAAVTIAYGVVAWAWPHAVLWATSWEGPVEQVSHVLLAAVLVPWVGATAGLLRRRRPLDALGALGVTLYLAFLLLEETDWGLIYGLDLGLAESIGAPAVHTLVRYPEKLWTDVQFWIAMPAVLWCGARLPPLSRGGEYDPARPLPLPAEAVSFFVILAGPVVWSGAGRVLGAGRDGPLFDVMGLYQLLAYVLFGLVGVRVLRAVVRIARVPPVR